MRTARRMWGNNLPAAGPATQRSAGREGARTNHDGVLCHCRTAWGGHGEEQIVHRHRSAGPDPSRSGRPWLASGQCASPRTLGLQYFPWWALLFTRAFHEAAKVLALHDALWAMRSSCPWIPSAPARPGSHRSRRPTGRRHPPVDPQARLYRGRSGASPW